LVITMCLHAHIVLHFSILSCLSISTALSRFFLQVCSENLPTEYESVHNIGNEYVASGEKEK